MKLTDLYSLMARRRDGAQQLFRGDRPALAKRRVTHHSRRSAPPRPCDAPPNSTNEPAISSATAADPCGPHPAPADPDDTTRAGRAPIAHGAVALSPGGRERSHAIGRP